MLPRDQCGRKRQIDQERCTILSRCSEARTETFRSCYLTLEKLKRELGKADLIRSNMHLHKLFGRFSGAESLKYIEVLQQHRATLNMVFSTDSLAYQLLAIERAISSRIPQGAATISNSPQAAPGEACFRPSDIGNMQIERRTYQNRMLPLCRAHADSPGFQERPKLNPSKSNTVSIKAAGVGAAGADELLDGWEQCHASGRAYFVDHNTRTTAWHWIRKSWNGDKVGTRDYVRHGISIVVAVLLLVSFTPYLFSFVPSSGATTQPGTSHADPQTSQPPPSFDSVAPKSAIEPSLTQIESTAATATPLSLVSYINGIAFYQVWLENTVRWPILEWLHEPPLSATDQDLTGLQHCSWRPKPAVARLARYYSYQLLDYHASVRAQLLRYCRR